MPAVLKADRLAVEPLFSDVSFVLNPGERIGVVGPNGVGKTTLLRALAGLRPATGMLTAPADLGYLAQEVPDPAVHVGDYLAGGLPPAAADLRAAERRLAVDAGPAALRAYDAALEAWTAARGWEFESRLAAVRDRLGIAELPDALPLARISGGQQARLMLARLLLREPTALLLDEPTNHLDADGARWLAEHLRGYRGGVLVVSHDRAFLDGAVDRVLELDGIHPRSRCYTGGYTAYRAERAERWRRQLLDFEAQEKARARLAADIERTRSQALGVEQSTHNDRLRRYAKKVARKAKARERRLNRQMRSAAWVERPTTRPSLVLDLAGRSDPAATVLRARSLAVGPPGRTVLSDVDLAVGGGARIVVSGVNGGGKSTLLRTLAGELAPRAGVVEAAARRAYLPQVHDDLPRSATALSYLRGRLPLYEEDAEALLDTYLFDADEARKPLARFSSGEIRRLLIACAVNSGAEVLLLDEPTNHLDFDSLDVVEEALRGFGGTLLVVTHDRYFAERIGPTHRWHVAGGRCAAA